MEIILDSFLNTGENIKWQCLIWCTADACFKTNKVTITTKFHVSDGMLP